MTALVALLVGSVYVGLLWRRLRAQRLDAWRELQRDRGRLR